MSRGPLAPVTPAVLERPAVRDALATTDWADCAVLDIVEYRPATGRGFEDDRARTEVHRHGRRAPAPEDYATPERRCTVYRLTEPLVEQVQG